MELQTILRKTKFSVTLFLGLCFASPTLAQTGPITAQEDGANRVNISGRQRMLSQRMAKAACYIGIGSQVDYHHEMLTNAQKQFAAALDALRHGDDSMRLLAPKNQTVGSAFDPVVEIWGPFEEQVSLLIADHSDTNALAYIIQQNGNLLSRSNDAVTIMADQFGGSAISEDVANTINIAGRQRMLSQRMSKGFCQVLREPGNTQAMTEFLAAFDLFERSHAALMNGDASISVIAPPTADLSYQLILVDEAWTAMREDLELAATGLPPTNEAAERVSKYSEILLTEMNKAVGLYGVAVEAGS